MLPTAATALPAAKFAHVFEKYAFLAQYLTEFYVYLEKYASSSAKPRKTSILNCQTVNRPPYHPPWTPLPRGGVTQREPWPAGLTGNK